jgi:hypothetical protein
MHAGKGQVQVRDGTPHGARQRDANLAKRIDLGGTRKTIDWN